MTLFLSQQISGNVICDKQHECLCLAMNVSSREFFFVFFTIVICFMDRNYALRQLNKVQALKTELDSTTD